MSLAARIVLALLAGVIAAGAGWRQGVKSTEARWTAERLIQTRAQAEAERHAREAERATVQRIQEAHDAATQRRQVAEAAAAGLRTERDRLLDAVAAATPASAAAGDPRAALGADDAARARTVVGHCAQSLSALAETADACEGRLTALQEWVRAAGLVGKK